MRRLAVPSLALVAVAAIMAGSAGADPAVPSLPAYGAFVIGNANASPGRWSCSGVRSTGRTTPPPSSDIPPSFKGFASAPSMNRCDGPFTTQPGNSSHPPDGPLPELMITLVTDSVSKDGRTITGSVIGLAVVASDPGDHANPGHAGTGMVVASSRAAAQTSDLTRREAAAPVRPPPPPSGVGREPRPELGVLAHALLDVQGAEDAFAHIAAASR